MSSPAHLYTFGYEGLDIAAFIERLKSAGIRSVVDVRELPLSRKRGFSKTAFNEALTAAGIAYFHAPALGCQKDVREQYKRDQSWSRYTTGFMKHLGQQRAAVAELAKLAKSTSACLVCFEADFNFCHRSMVADAVNKQCGAEVGHISVKTTGPAVRQAAYA